MKKSIRILFLICLCFLINPAVLQAQFLVEGYSFNGGIMIGAGYEIEDKMTLEWRLGMSSGLFDSHFIVANFQFVNKEEVELYSGPGFAFFSESNNSFLWPFGANIYPFKQKNFGFHMELMSFFNEETQGLLGLWGIRYRFGKSRKGKEED